MPRSFAAFTARSALVALVLAVASPAAAQGTYPTRSILLTHGFGAGGNGDVVSRIVGEAIWQNSASPSSSSHGPGPAATDASARLVKSEPDGYTLITLTGGHAVSAAIYKSLPFNSVDDFQFISVYGYQAFMVGVEGGDADQEHRGLDRGRESGPW